MVSFAREKANGVRAIRTLQPDMTQEDLRWSIRDGPNPIGNSGKGNWFDKVYIAMGKTRFFITIIILKYSQWELRDIRRDKLLWMSRYCKHDLEFLFTYTRSD